MQYISPLHLVELSGADTIDRKDLLLAKKKMLAELELNDGKGVEINGKEVSKNDIIRFFDELQQSTDLSWHLAVYHDKVLLAFLEHAILNKNDRFAGNPLYADEAFIDWLGPYYADAFTVFARGCFQHLMDDEWATLLANPLLMNSYQQETVWEALDKDIQADIEKLKFYADKRMTKAGIDAIAPICDFKHVMMLERLPVERFAGVRDELAFCIMQVCITAFNNANQGWARNTIENAHILAVSEELKKQVYDKRYEMETIAAGKGSSEKIPLWTILRIALFVLFVASRIGNGCNSSSYQYNTPVFNSNSIYRDTSLRALQERLEKGQRLRPVNPGDTIAVEEMPPLPAKQ